MLILDILKVVLPALKILLACAVVFVLLAIIAHAKEELENNATAKALFNQVQSTIEALKKTTMIAEFQPLYNQPSLIDFGWSWMMAMAQRCMASSKPRHDPRHRIVTGGNFFEDGFESFARGFDKHGGLLEKRAPRHALGHIGSRKYLEKMGDLAY